MPVVRFFWVVMLCGWGLLAWAEEAQQGAVVSEEEVGNFSSLLPASGELRTEKRELEVIAPSEFKPVIRYLPQLIEKIQIERLASDSPYVLLPHRPNYLLPVTWQNHPSNEHAQQMLQALTGDPKAGANVPELNHVEVAFQFSLKYRLNDGWLGKFSRIEFAYTNRSFWQAYNKDVSSPFRETNHEPELIFSWLTRNQWVDYFSVALNHQSNGQTSAISRSWNRVIWEGGSVLPQGILRMRLWWRIPEAEKKTPFSSQGDDNPNIENYLGYGEVSYIYPFAKQNVSLVLRNNLNSAHNRAAMELGWTFPLTKRMQGYVQYFNGYGESLIDYDRNQQRIGLGIKLSDWL